MIKGEVLSLYAYGKLGKRFSSDIDILVSRKSLNFIENLLDRYQFVTKEQSRSDQILMLSASHQVAPRIKEISPWGSVAMDINFDVFWGEYSGKRISIDEFLSDTTDVEIYGTKIKTLSLLKTMVQLILHHYKEMNSIYHLAQHNSINYDMFKDVYYLWKNNGREISLEELYKISLEYEIIPYVFYVLYYANKIFNDNDLKKYVDAFETPEGIGLLHYYGLAENERKVWKVDFWTRLDSKNIYELIKDDLINSDIQKLERNRRIFG